MKPATKLIHFNSILKDPYHANSTPIYQTATFSQNQANEQGEYDYSRSGNPTRSVVEEQLAELDNAKHAFAFASGMTAISAICRLLKPNDEVIAGIDIYGGTHRYFTKILAKQGIKINFVSTIENNAIANAINKNTKLIWVETPSNPLQHITDIENVAKMITNKKILFIVDNSFLSSWLQQPLSLGADIVIQSATKHLSGHSDISAGVITVNNPELAQHFRFIQNSEGIGLAPFECWLLLRGIQTLALRMEKQQNNAKKIAAFLSNQKQVKQIYYPGLVNHSGYDIQKKQASGPGTVISFETSDIKTSKLIVEACKLYSISVSFGNVKSMISLPCYMSHASIDENENTLPRDLIRISVGIEDIEDLLNDLNHALKEAELFSLDNLVNNFS